MNLNREAWKKAHRVLACMLLVLFAFSILPASSERAYAANPIEEARNGVFYVVAVFEDGSVSFGTGFGVGLPGEPVEYVVTNRHVFYDLDSRGLPTRTPREVFVVIDGNRINSNSFVASAPWGKDIAVFGLSEPTSARKNLQFLPSKYVDVADTVYALGFPDYADATVEKASLDDITVTKGTVSRKRVTIDKTSFLQTDALLSHGNSGGPLVNEDGFVVGMNTLGLTADGDSAARAGYAIESEEIIEFLESMSGIGIKYSEAQPTEDKQGSEEHVPRTPAPAEKPETPPAAQAEAGEEPAAEESTGNTSTVLAITGAAILFAAVLAGVLLRRSQTRRPATTVTPKEEPCEEPWKQPDPSPDPDLEVEPESSDENLDSYIVPIDIPKDEPNPTERTGETNDTPVEIQIVHSMDNLAATASEEPQENREPWSQAGFSAPDTVTEGLPTTELVAEDVPDNTLETGEESAPEEITPEENGGFEISMSFGGAKAKDE